MQFADFPLRVRQALRTPRFFCLVFGLGLIPFSFPALALSGKVVDKHGKAIANARVEIIDNGQVLFTDAEGSFSVDLEAVDEIHVDAEGYAHEVLHLHERNPELLTLVLKRSVIEQVDVIGLPLHASTMESSQPISVVSGDELRNRQASTLGETLKHQVGVHSSYFGPVASSPIIRGLDGPRVLITQNGLDAGDASRVGPDHVVATEASTAKQIEILRGPSTLFFGSGAIGGVVNVVDDRVPSDSESRTALMAQYNSVAEETEISAAHTGGTTSLAFHVDGFWRDGDDYTIPEADHEEEHDHEEEEHEEHDSTTLDNSAGDSQGFNLGASLLMDTGYAGLSYGKLERSSGVPGHSHGVHEEEGEEEEEHEEEHEEHEQENVFSELDQDRWQFISELQLGAGWLSGLNTRIGYTDYEHKELHEEAGIREVGTVFKNRTLQARFDFLHKELGGWRGALSLDYKNSDFEAQGEEAFTAPSTTETFALALMEEKHTGNLLWQLGARLEHVQLDAENLQIEHHHEEEHEEEEHQAQPASRQWDFQPLSVSAGVVWDFSPGYNASLAYTHAQRAPSASELFAFGPHVGTGAFEIGALYEFHEEEDEVHVDYAGDASEEISNNIDISLRKYQGDLGFIVNFFYNEISDYYYEVNTGYSSHDILAHEEEEEEEHAEHEHAQDLPVYLFRQDDASFYGVEAELAWQFAPSFKWTVWADAIRGELNDGGDLPRIPPMRFGSLINFDQSRWHAELSATRYFEQDKISANETLTPGYTMLDAVLSYDVIAGENPVSLVLKGANLLDEYAQVHTSFLKDQAPLPGRGFSVGFRGQF